MNVIFITEEDPFYVRTFFERYFECTAETRQRVQAVVILAPFNQKSPVRLAVKMWNFFGPVDFVRMTWRYLAVRVAGRTVAGVSRKAGIPVLRRESVNSPALLEELTRLAPDLIVSVAAPQRFKGPLLTLPRLGCINVHSGRLPAYRGMMPNFWQMVSGEREVTLTIHVMTERFDDGDILAEETLTIVDGESLDSLMRRSKIRGARLLAETVTRMASGTVSALPRRGEEGNYYSFPGRQDVKAFRARGYRLL